MFHIILFEPEIPQNTGNIIRLCANTGSRLHLVEPLGFLLDNRKLKRAGLDYHEYADIQTYSSLESCLAANHFNHLYALTTKGSTNYSAFDYRKDDAFLFGPETRGLPEHILNGGFLSGRLRIPMKAESRSLNLSNSVAVMVYEALRQNSFAGL